MSIPFLKFDLEPNKLHPNLYSYSPLFPTLTSFPPFPNSSPHLFFTLVFTFTSTILTFHPLPHFPYHLQWSTASLLPLLLPPSNSATPIHRRSLHLYHLSVTDPPSPTLIHSHHPFINSHPSLSTSHFILHPKVGSADDKRTKLSPSFNVPFVSFLFSFVLFLFSFVHFHFYLFSFFFFMRSLSF